MILYSYSFQSLFSIYKQVKIHPWINITIVVNGKLPAFSEDLTGILLKLFLGLLPKLYQAYSFRDSKRQPVLLLCSHCVIADRSLLQMSPGVIMQSRKSSF